MAAFSQDVSIQRRREAVVTVSMCQDYTCLLYEQEQFPSVYVISLSRLVPQFAIFLGLFSVLLSKEEQNHLAIILTVSEKAKRLYASD